MSPQSSQASIRRTNAAPHLLILKLNILDCVLPLPPSLTRHFVRSWSNLLKAVLTFIVPSWKNLDVHKSLENPRLQPLQLRSFANLRDVTVNPVAITKISLFLHKLPLTITSDIIVVSRNVYISLAASTILVSFFKILFRSWLNHNRHSWGWSLWILVRHSWWYDTQGTNSQDVELLRRGRVESRMHDRRHDSCSVQGWTRRPLWREPLARWCLPWLGLRRTTRLEWSLTIPGKVVNKKSFVTFPIHFVLRWRVFFSAV